MEYLDANALKAQEHFDKILMLAQNNESKEINWMEKSIFEELLKLGQTCLKMHIDNANRQDFGNHIKVTDGTGKLTHQGRRKTTILSIFGEIEFDRDYYQNPGQQGVFPLDKKLNLPSRKFTYLLEKFCMMGAIKDSYEEARDYIRNIFGLDLPVSSMQKIAGKSSKYFEDYYNEKAFEAPQKDDLLVVSLDGKGIPIRKEGKTEKKKRKGRGEKDGRKQMALVGTVYTVKPIVSKGKREFKPENKGVWACLEEKLRILDLMQENVKSRLKSCKTTVQLFIADGGRELWNYCKEHFPNAVEILDWYHMTEYLWKAVYVFFAEGSKDAVQWIEEMENKMREGKVSDVIKGIRVRITKNKIKGNKLKILNSVLTYFENNKSRMKYDEYLQNGYPIGSGNVEAACKHLVKDRMEKTGMRWKLPGAQSILSLRAIHINDNLEDYWKYYMGKENNHLYARMVA